MLGSPLRAMLFPQGAPGVPRDEGTAGTAQPKGSSVSDVPSESSCPTTPLSVQASRVLCRRFALPRFAGGAGQGEPGALDPLGTGNEPKAARHRGNPGTQRVLWEQQHHRGFLSFQRAPSLPCSLLPSRLASPAVGRALPGRECCCCLS